MRQSQPLPLYALPMRVWEVFTPICGVNANCLGRHGKRPLETSGYAFSFGLCLFFVVSGSWKLLICQVRSCSRAVAALGPPPAPAIFLQSHQASIAPWTEPPTQASTT